jgi:hypothetical protein
MKFPPLFRKKERAAFKYTPDLADYRLFPQQSQTVRPMYRFCKISMAVCIPLFTVVSFFSFSLSLLFLLALSFAAFYKIRPAYGLKAALVPLACSLSGILFGSVFFRYLLAPQEVPIAR